MSRKDSTARQADDRRTGSTGGQVARLYRGMAISLAYAVFDAVTGIRYASYFAVSMAVYYLLLGLLRARLAHACRRRPETGGDAYERRCCRVTAWALLLISLPMSGAILLLIRTNPARVYPGYIIYAAAAYTFYAVTVAVIHAVRCRKSDNGILAAAGTLNLVAAAMSLLGLQNNLISAFSAESESFRSLMNTLTGVAVFGTVLFAAARMIRRTSTTKGAGAKYEQVRK